MSKHLSADVETPVRRRTVTLRKPALVAIHHVKGVVAALRQQGIRDAQGHRRVIRPLPGLQQEGAAAHHVCDRIEGARPLELVRGAHRVADGQAHEGAARPRKKIRHAPSVAQGASSWATASGTDFPNGPHRYNECLSLPVKLGVYLFLARKK